jgi:hypothetical protein
LYHTAITVSVSKDNALTTLVTNRKNHIAEHDKQLAGWCAKMAQWNAEMVEWSMASAGRTQPKQPPRPRSYLAEYDALIVRLEHHLPALIDLDSLSFDRIFMNKFDWSGNFVESSIMYSGHPPDLEYGDEDDD